MPSGPFPRVKRPGRGADHPPPSKCRAHERVGLYLYSPSGPQWPVIGRTIPQLVCFIFRHEYEMKMREIALNNLHNGLDLF